MCSSDLGAASTSIRSGRHPAPKRRWFGCPGSRRGSTYRARGSRLATQQSPAPAALSALRDAACLPWSSSDPSDTPRSCPKRSGSLRRTFFKPRRGAALRLQRNCRRTIAVCQSAGKPSSIAALSCRVDGGRIGPLAANRCQPRQARKGAAVAADSGAGVRLVRHLHRPPGEVSERPKEHAWKVCMG